MKPPKDLTAGEIIDNLLATNDKTRRLLEAARQRLAVPPEAPGQNETAQPHYTNQDDSCCPRKSWGQPNYGGTPKTVSSGVSKEKPAASPSTPAASGLTGFGVGAGIWDRRA